MVTKISKRDHVLHELVDTECKYVEDLQALKENIMLPMQKFISLDQIHSIFYKIPELIEIHQIFLDKLKDTIFKRETGETNSIHQLSQVFLECYESFSIYGDYCANMTKALCTLSKVSKHPLFKPLLQRCVKRHNKGATRFQLSDMLPVPMQRILKYHLLLNDLVNATSPTHDDYQGLQRAKEAMVDVAQFTNEVKRDSEHLDVIQKIRESIVDLPNGNDLTQYGRLLLEGDLNIKAPEDGKVKPRYAYIFDKAIMFVKTTTKSNQYSFREMLNLDEFWLEEGPEERTVGLFSRFKFKILLTRKTQYSYSFTLYMKTEAEKNKWMQPLQEAMDNLRPFSFRNTDHKFKLTTFKTAVICGHCSKFLKGLIHQGYRCKVCDICIHKECISSCRKCDK